MKKLVILLTTALVLQFIASCKHRKEAPDSTNMDAIQMHINETKGNYIYFSHGEFHTVITNKQQADANPHLDIKYNDDPHHYHF